MCEEFAQSKCNIIAQEKNHDAIDSFEKMINSLYKLHFEIHFLCGTQYHLKNAVEIIMKQGGINGKLFC